MPLNARTAKPATAQVQWQPSVATEINTTTFASIGPSLTYDHPNVGYGLNIRIHSQWYNNTPSYGYLVFLAVTMDSTDWTIGWVYMSAGSSAIHVPHTCEKLWPAGTIYTGLAKTAQVRARVETSARAVRMNAVDYIFLTIEEIVA